MSGVDLHTHTTASDGTLPPRELVRAAVRRGVRVLAITDHDTTDGLAEAMDEAARHPPLTLVPGLEINCDVPGAEDSVRRLAVANLVENFKIADDMLAGREFFFDHFTAPDAHFFWCLRRATQFEVDLSAFKNCMAHFERMKQRPSVQKVFAYENSVQEQFAKAA